MSNTNTKPDILVFLSDQHNVEVIGFAGDSYVNTPNLDRLASEGLAFGNAYTSCPLCVPARSSMLTGQLPSRTGILTNQGVITSEQATFVHSLGAAGYETVLCGRMHFMGPDQRHGFERRYVGDFTPCYHGRYGKVRSDLGPYVGTPAGDFTKHYGGGTSPVLEYDRAVVRSALDVLTQPHGRPLLLVVGTYGPHHTYVAPDELYRKYLDLLPHPEADADSARARHPVIDDRARQIEPEVAHRLRAAYYGMVEHIDAQLGLIRDAWSTYVSGSGRPDLFCYLSDHGDQIGEKRQWGKMTFYESSVAIPMIFSGSSVAARGIVDDPASIIDVSPTLCELAGAPHLPEPDGISQLPVLSTTARYGGADESKRSVLSELLQPGDPPIPGRMIRRGDWKYVSYAGYEAHDLLFNLADDPEEDRNVRDECPIVAAGLREELRRGWDPHAVVREHERRSAHWRILSQWGANVPVPEPDRWQVPESSWELPRV
jgi:choline-sulfatase